MRIGIRFVSYMEFDSKEDEIGKLNESEMQFTIRDVLLDEFPLQALAEVTVDIKEITEV